MLKPKEPSKTKIKKTNISLYDIYYNRENRDSNDLLLKDFINLIKDKCDNDSMVFDKCIVKIEEDSNGYPEVIIVYSEVLDNDDYDNQYLKYTYNMKKYEEYRKKEYERYQKRIKEYKEEFKK